MGSRPEDVLIDLVDVVTLQCVASIGPGIHCLGGSDSDDVQLNGLPAVAAVVEVGAHGTVGVRRSSLVDGGDSDAFFGSPTEGRAIRFSAAEVAQGAATFRLNGHLLALKSHHASPETMMVSASEIGPGSLTSP